MISELQDLQEEFRQRVSAAETHDLARRVRCPQEVQMHRLRKGFQVQTPPKGKPLDKILSWELCKFKDCIIQSILFPKLIEKFLSLVMRQVLLTKSAADENYIRCGD